MTKPTDDFQKILGPKEGSKERGCALTTKRSAVGDWCVRSVTVRSV